MSTYMLQLAYTPEAWSALVKNPEDREAVARRAVEAVGGRLLSFYFVHGDYDAVAIFEAPDEVAATAGVLAGIAGGHIKTTKTSTLLTSQDAMEAMRRAGQMTVRPPGK
jgi:uncharacterized protein with GYD domain